MFFSLCGGSSQNVGETKFLVYFALTLDLFDIILLCFLKFVSFQKNESSQITQTIFVLLPVGYIKLSLDLD